MLKKLFGGIDLNWKKLILFAIISGIYAGIAALPFAKDTSFQEITNGYGAWILFGIIIIANSKSPIDSALKCFVFFLISQPIIYLVQVPFRQIGFSIFSYYDTSLIIRIIFTIPMGLIGYYINKRNIWSYLILLPMFIMLGIMGLTSLQSAFNNFPRYLFAPIFYFSSIIIITLGIINKKSLKALSFSLLGISVATYLILFGIKIYEVNVDLSEYGISLGKGSHVSMCRHTGVGKESNAKVVKNEDEYKLQIRSHRNSKYKISIVEFREGKSTPETTCYVESHFDIFGNFNIDKVEKV